MLGVVVALRICTLSSQAPSFSMVASSTSLSMVVTTFPSLGRIFAIGIVVEEFSLSTNPKRWARKRSLASNGDPVADWTAPRGERYIRVLPSVDDGAVVLRVGVLSIDANPFSDEPVMAMGDRPGEFSELAVRLVLSVLVSLFKSAGSRIF